jgi:hypothetical protein
VGGAAGGVDPAARFEGCVPRCLAELFARCLVPAGSCVSEMMMNGLAMETLSCHRDGVTVYDHGYPADSIGLYGPNGLCYGVTPMRNAENRVEGIYYLGAGTTTYGFISLDAPGFRTGTASCGPDRNDAQPFNFDDPACSFLKKGIAYEDPSVQCSSGTCPIPPNL